MHRLGLLAPLVLVLILLGCDRSVSLSLQSASSPAEAPIAVICTVRPHSTCTPETLRSSLHFVLAHATSRGIAAELWLSRPNEPATLIKVIPPFKSQRRASSRTLGQDRALWISATADDLIALTLPYLQAATTSSDRRQRIAEAISLVSSAHAPAGPRSIVVVTDGRESSRFGDADCKLLQPNTFVSAVGATLPPGSLRQVSVHFWFQTKQQPKLRSCVSTPKKEKILANTWNSAVSAAGGTISFSVGTSMIEVPSTASANAAASPKE